MNYFNLPQSRSKLGRFISLYAILTIEFFFILAAMTESYILMAAVFAPALLASLSNLLVRAENGLRSNSLILCVAVFISYVSVRALAQLTAKSLVDIYFYFGGLIVIFSVRNIKQSFDWPYVQKLCIALGAFFALGVYLQFLFNDFFMLHYFPLFAPEYRDSIHRQVVSHQMYTGWTSQTFATSLNLIIGIYALLPTLRRKNKVSYFLLAFIIGGLILTGKRGPTLFCICSVIFCESVLRPGFGKKVLNLFKYSLIVLLVLAGSLFYFSTRQVESRNVIVRILESMNQSSGDVSNGRFILWHLAWRLFLSSPLFGIGWRRYREVALKALGDEIEVHNVYLQILTETGILGLGVFLLCLIPPLFFTYKKYMFFKKRGEREGMDAIKFSLFLQVFLLGYCLTGNVLYDHCAFLLLLFSYMISCAEYQTNLL